MKKLIIALALVLTAGTTMAQNETKFRWPHFETNRFIDNWELSVDAGVQTMYVFPNEKDGYTLNPEGFGKDFTFAFDAFLNKWFTPIVGLRVGFIGFGYDNYYINGTDDTVDASNKYWTIQADFLVNLTNWICGYKVDRFYNAIFFIGGGYAQSQLKDDYNTALDDGEWNRELMGSFGLINRFRLCDAWSINLELRDNIVRNAFSNYSRNINFPAKTEYGAANIFSATAGLTYRFKNRNFNAYEPIDKAAYDNRISSLEKDLQDTKDQNEEYKKQVEKYKKALDEETKAKNDALAKAAKNNDKTADTDVSLSIFFPLGSSEVSESNKVNIKYIADIIKTTNKKFTVTGYADKETGTEDFNLKLSQSRAEAVRDAIVAEGVDANMITVDYKGCSVQPFEKAFLNRVAIITK